MKKLLATTGIVFGLTIAVVNLIGGKEKQYTDYTAKNNKSNKWILIGKN